MKGRARHLPDSCLQTSLEQTNHDESGWIFIKIGKESVKKNTPTEKNKTENKIALYDRETWSRRLREFEKKHPEANIWAQN